MLGRFGLAMSPPYPNLRSMPYCWRGWGLMFGDDEWLDFRESIQDHAFQRWLRGVERPVVLEIGAGTSLPTIRMIGQRVGGPIIRVNLRESQVPRTTDIGLAMRALEGLHGIAAALARNGGA